MEVSNADLLILAENTSRLIKHVGELTDNIGLDMTPTQAALLENITHEITWIARWQQEMKSRRDVHVTLV